MSRFVCCLVCASSLVAQQFSTSTARVPAEIPPGDWSMLALADCDGDGSLAVPGFRGRLLLPLATAVPLTLLVAASGTVTSGFAIPPVVSLIGTEVSVQGITVTSSGFAFTNVVDERILP